MFAPFSSLRLRGSICPCILNEEESVVLSSYNALTKICQSLRWHQIGKKLVTKEGEEERVHEKNAKNNGALGFFSNILSKSASVADSLGLEKVDVVDASWCIRDSSCFPLIGRSRVVIELTAVDPDPSKDTQTMSNLLIPLKRIGLFKKSPNSSNVSWTNVDDGGYTTTTQNVHVISIYGHGDSTAGNELARLEILAEDGVIADEIVQHFTILLEWDRERRRNSGDDEEDEDDVAQSNKSMLREKAEKAAQFAKKELEMRERRRDREQKKAKYLKDGGGLKYTALAMANRS